MRKTELLFKEEIDTDLIDEIEYLFLVKSSYENIMKEIVYKKTEYEYNKEILDYFMQSYIESRMKFTQLHKTIVKTFSDEYLNESKYYVQYNFESKEIEIYKYVYPNKKEDK